MQQMRRYIVANERSFLRQKWCSETKSYISLCMQTVVLKWIKTVANCGSWRSVCVGTGLLVVTAASHSECVIRARAAVGSCSHRFRPVSSCWSLPVWLTALHLFTTRLLLLGGGSAELAEAQPACRPSSSKCTLVLNKKYFLHFMSNLTMLKSPLLSLEKKKMLTCFSRDEWKTHWSFDRLGFYCCPI